MNANELADWLDNYASNSYCSEFEQSATMLRQQKLEIETLKAEIVAIEKNTDYWADNYTHPVKELTDEEIDKIVKDCIEDDYHMISNPYAVAHMVQEAILRKAQEK